MKHKISLREYKQTKYKETTLMAYQRVVANKIKFAKRETNNFPDVAARIIPN